MTVTAALSGGAASATNTTKCTIHEPQLQCFADVTESRVRPVYSRQAVVRCQRTAVPLARSLRQDVRAVRDLSLLRQKVLFLLSTGNDGKSSAQRSDERASLLGWSRHAFFQKLPSPKQQIADQVCVSNFQAAAAV